MKRNRIEALRNSNKLHRGGIKKDQYSNFRWIFNKMNSRGKNNGLTLEILKQQWDRQQGLCAYTNIQMTLDRSKKNIFEQASLDRIDFKLPYQKDNIHYVILSLNYAKNNSSDEDFRAFLKKTKNNLKES